MSCMEAMVVLENDGGLCGIWRLIEPFGGSLRLAQFFGALWRLVEPYLGFWSLMDANSALWNIMGPHDGAASAHF